MLQDDSKQHAEDIDWCKREIEKLKRLIDGLATKDELKSLQARIDELSKLIDGLKKMINAMRAAQGQPALTNNDIGGGNDENLEQLTNDLDSLRKEFEDHRAKANSNLMELNMLMPTKADKKDLENLEARIAE